MVLTLHNIGKRKRARKKYGRGNGSGHGTYSGRGSKGQRARSGGKKGLKIKGFRNTMLPTPKFKGMKSDKPKAQIVKLAQLEKFFNDGDKVTPGSISKKGLVADAARPIKILAENKESKISKKFEIFGCAASAGAKAAIEKTGGKFVAEEKSF